MRVVGEVVEVESYDWEFGNRSGTSYFVYVKETGGRPQDAAQRVVCSLSQSQHVKSGQKVDWPVRVTANTNDQGQAKVKVSLPQEFVTAQPAVARTA